MRRNDEPNPLDVHNIRKLSHCPPHFEKVTFKLATKNQKDITDWIYENLSGRFFVGHEDIEQSGSFERHLVIGFELSTEASYFSLSSTTIFG